MAFDKFEYHCGAADFPSNVSTKNGGTHIGMFIDWARKRGLLNEELRKFSSIGTWLLRHGIITGRTFAATFGDWSFSSEDHLNRAGHAFGGILRPLSR